MCEFEENKIEPLTTILQENIYGQDIALNNIIAAIEGWELGYIMFLYLF